MTTVILAGTRDGVHIVDEDRTIDVGGEVSALASADGVWAVIDQVRVAYSSEGERWQEVATLSGLAVRCLLPLGTHAVAGTSEAHVYRVRSGGAEPVESFEQVPGREQWSTPWGGPPDTRSLARDEEGAIFANVHVGGIPRSEDHGRSWTPTIDIAADVHQVLADGELVFAACARGLAVSSDRGATWRTDHEGLHGRYCRAVAVAGDTELVSASTGPFTKQAAVYRRPRGSPGPFQKCRGGLPEWFSSNVDTFLLAGDEERAVLGTADGEVWVSSDEGTSWELGATGLSGLAGLVLFSPGAGS